MRVVKGAYLADSVVVTGDVVLGAGANLWFGTIVRGDLARITLGDAANIQDGCILHTDFGVPLTVGPRGGGWARGRAARVEHRGGHARSGSVPAASRERDRAGVHHRGRMWSSSKG